jgi:hypothetical protein
MFFRSSKSIVLAIILLGIGGFQLMTGRHYMDVSKREASTAGRLVQIRHGKGTAYDFLFQVNGASILGQSRACKTALAEAGCEEGAPVLVYYDCEDVTESLLEDFGAAGRGKVLFGVCLASLALLLIGLHFLFKKALASPDESEEIDYDKPDDGPEVIHVVPTE